MAKNEAKNYIDELADAIGERCEIKNERLLRMYALVGLIQGTGVTLEAVYDAWATWRVSTTLDVSKVKPYDDSPKSRQELVEIESAIIAAVEAKLHREARAEMDQSKPSSRSPEQARPGMSKPASKQSAGMNSILELLDAGEQILIHTDTEFCMTCPSHDIDIQVIITVAEEKDCYGTINPITMKTLKWEAGIGYVHEIVRDDRWRPGD